MDPALAERIVAEAYPAALAFFQLSPEWFLEPPAAEPIQPDNGGEAKLLYRTNYLHAKVIYDPERHDGGEHLWRNIGHEVAHLLFMEYEVLEEGLKGEPKRLMTHANERTVTRLTRLWARERPYPGDAHFQPAP